MGGLSMFFFVVECFSVNLEKLAADTVRGPQIGRIYQDIERQARFIAKTLPESAHQVDQVGGLHTDRTKVGDKAAKLAGLVLDGLLERSEATGDGFVAGTGG